MFGNEWLRTAECKPGAALADKARASRIFRPRLELLEDRVQLGDTILGLSAVALWGLDLPSRDAPFVLDSAGHDRQWPHGHFSRLDTLAWLSRANSRTTTSPHSKISPRSQTGVWERGRDDSGDLLATARSGLLGIDDLLASALFADPVQGLGTPAPAQGPKAHGHVSAGAGGTSLAVAAGSAVLSGATGYGSA